MVLSCRSIAPVHGDGVVVAGEQRRLKLPVPVATVSAGHASTQTPFSKNLLLRQREQTRPIVPPVPLRATEHVSQLLKGLQVHSSVLFASTRL
jgi:hypothetical protein